MQSVGASDGRLGETIAAGDALDLPRRSQAAEREAIAFGLLPYEVAFAGAPVAEHACGDVQLRLELDRGAGEHRPSQAGCAVDRLANSLVKLSPKRRCERDGYERHGLRG